MQIRQTWLTVFLLSCLAGESSQHRLFNEYPRNTQKREAEVAARVLLEIQVGDQECNLPYWLRTLQELHCPGSCDVHIRPLTTGAAVLAKSVSAYVEQHFKQFTDVVFAADRHCPDNRDQYDYLFSFTTDHFIVNGHTIENIIAKKKLFAAPMLDVPGENRVSEVGLPHSFVTSNLDQIDDVLSRNTLGCFSANITDLPVLVDLKLWKELVSTDVPCGDGWLLKAAEVLHKEKLEAGLCNREFYGYTPETVTAWEIGSPHKDWELRCQAIEHMLLEHQLRGPNRTYLDPLGRVTDFEVPQHGRHERLFTLDGVDKIYVINLRRRKDRLDRTAAALEVLNMKAQVVEAYDGSQMTLDDVRNMNVKVVEPYVDPYNNRPINLGEVACSLSHYWVWNDANARKYRQIIVLEDDARFGLLFKYKLNRTLDLLSQQRIQWDMIYLGRKIMDVDERFIASVPTLVRPNYSHWTVAYMLSRSGIIKLMKQRFLSRMLPVDEFLPLMYDQQPMEYLKEFFPDREILNTFAFQPSIVQPTHYYGEPSYISDTENTTVVS